VATEEFAQPVLAPAVWVASDNQSIIKVAPEWRQRAPESLALTAGSGWSVHELNGKEVFTGIATNSIRIFNAYDHPKKAYMVRDEVISIPLEAINNGYDLSKYKYTRVIWSGWSGRRGKRKIRVDRPGVEPTSE
jgi:hypothetical protein